MVIIMGIIFYLSHLPGNFIRLPPAIGVDKLLHFTAYGILAASFLYGLQTVTRQSRRALTVIIVVLFCALFGVSDEFHQAFVPGRSVSGWDVAADTCGALFAVTIWYMWTERKAGKKLS
jgi:VanZ family protein